MRNQSRSVRYSSRYSSDQDDFASDFDDGFSRESGQEKFRQFISDLIGRWHWIAFGLIIGLLGATYYLSKAPKTFVASSTVLIKERTSQVMSTRDQVDEIDLRSVEAMNTVAARLVRPELLQKVASRPDIRSLQGLVPKKVDWLPSWASKWLKDKAETPAPPQSGVATAPPPQNLAAMIVGWIEISVRKNTRLLDISVVHPVPEVAKAVADAIALEYQAELTSERGAGRNSSLEILVKESERSRTQLQTAQTSLANYDRALTTLKELETKEQAANEMARRYLPKHPKMITAQSEINAIQQKFLQEFDSARNSTSDREYWEANKSEWADKEGKEKLQVARRLLLSRGSVLESEIKSQTSMFNGMLTRIQEVDINKQGDDSELEISSLALLPSSPSSPKPVTAVASGAFGGAFLGTLLAVLFIRLDNKFYTVSQVERETGMMVLGAISEIPLKLLSDAVRRRKVNQSQIPVARRRWQPHLVFREGVSSTTFAEMFRVLRASVSLLGEEDNRRIVLFSSALPGEGKTFMSSNFALAAAQQGKKTLLIDLDIRKPSVHKMFGLQRDTHPKGSTDYLSGLGTLDECIFKDTGEENLHILLSGKKPFMPSPGELFNPTVLTALINEASEKYDQIVIDSAPLLAVPDTRLIIPIVDNFCLVVRAQYVPKKAVQRVITLLESNGNLPAGIVFNGFSEKRRLIGQNYSYGNYQTNRYGKAYRYGYGAYGAYGSDEN